MATIIDNDAESGARSLALFRILIGAVTLWQALVTAPDLPMLVGEFGLMQTTVSEALAPPALPTFTLFRQLWERGVVAETQLIYFAFVLYAIALFYMTVGYRTSLTASVALLLHLLFKSSGYASAYGAHELVTNGLFFCIFLPVGRRFAISNREASPDPFSTRVALVVLRFYLTIVYVSSGTAKVAGEPWRDGRAIWNFLMRPDVPLDFSWISAAPWIAVAAGWFVLVLEMGYFLCVFSARARVAWLVATTLMHLGIALSIHLWFFSMTMVAFNCGALGCALPLWLSSRQRPPWRLSRRLVAAR